MVPEFAMSLNEYRNTNQFVLNNLKTEWNDFISKLVLEQGLQPIHGPVVVTYVFHFPTNGRRDADNTIITPKFTHDALVKCGILQEDDFTHIPQLRILRGINAKPKYVEIYLEEA